MFDSKNHEPETVNDTETKSTQQHYMGVVCQLIGKIIHSQRI